jgi:hypothetical protein
MKDDFTGAILFWGIPIESTELPEFKSSWHEEYALRRGVDDRTKWSAEECTAESGCLFDSLGFGSEGHRFAAIADSVAEAGVGCLQEAICTEAGPDWEERLRSFCAALNLPWKQPAWNIACADCNH